MAPNPFAWINRLLETLAVLGCVQFTFAAILVRYYPRRRKRTPCELPSGQHFGAAAWLPSPGYSIGLPRSVIKIIRARSSWCSAPGLITTSPKPCSG